MKEFYLKFGIDTRSLYDYGFHESNLFQEYTHICVVAPDTHIMYRSKDRKFILKASEQFDFSSALDVLLKMYLDKILVVK